MGRLNLSTERRRVVIIGAGFGGLTAAKTLARAAFDVTVIDQHNYHLFQPLLYHSRPQASPQPTSPRRSEASCAIRRIPRWSWPACQA